MYLVKFFLRESVIVRLIDCRCLISGFMINSNYITFNFILNFCKRDNLNQTKIIMKIGISSFILKK